MDGSNTVKEENPHLEEFGCDMSIPLRIYATVTQSEIMPVCIPTSEVLNARGKGEKVVICPDSESSVKSLGSVKVSLPLLLQCFRILGIL